MLFMGLDPGKSGAVAIVDVSGGDCKTMKFDNTPRDVADFIAEHAMQVKLAVLEKVGAMPPHLKNARQGVSSTFKFGASFGICIGMLAALEIPYEEITPAMWQRSMRCLTKGDKNVSKAAAQRLFPRLKITHATADALLLAEYARRLWHERHRSET